MRSLVTEPISNYVEILDNATKLFYLQTIPWTNKLDRSSLAQAFQPCLIFESTDGSYSRGAHLRCSTQRVGSWSSPQILDEAVDRCACQTLQLIGTERHDEGKSFNLYDPLEPVL